mmetsp:Transcript_9002/g.20682  ORF Transcript_9002/g.20682 Transcript_9002/m.20682 type:complete len:911 (-) Transcript_9002:137-2869(-)
MAAIHAKLNDVGAKLATGEINMKMFESSPTPQKTTFVWATGRFKNMRMGNFLKSPIVTAGGAKWYCLFYPKGFTRQDYASLYLCCLKCEDEDIDPPDWTAFVEFKVSVQLKKPTKIVKKKAGAAGEAADDDKKSSAGKTAKTKSKGGSSARSGSAASGSSAASSRSRSLSASSASSSGGGSEYGDEDEDRSQKTGGTKKSSSSSKRSTTSSSGEDADNDKKPKFFERAFSATFSRENPSWGISDLFDLQKLYSTTEGIMTNASGQPFDETPPQLDEERVAHNPQDGRLEMKLELTAVADVANDIETSEDMRTPDGKQRVMWIIHKFWDVVKKLEPNQKISSTEFEADGKWYFDLYPRGYQIEGADRSFPSADEEAHRKGYLSLFLHSGTRQSAMGGVMKQQFSLGIQIQSLQQSAVAEVLEKNAKGQQDAPKKKKPNIKPGDVEIVCNITTIFRGLGAAKGLDSPRVFGKKKFKPLFDFTNNKYLSGDCNNGGDVYFVMDMLVTSEESVSVKQFLFFDKTTKSTCFDCKKTLFLLSSKINCAQCGEVHCANCTRDMARLPEYGYERNARNRINEVYLDRGRVRKLLDSAFNKPPPTLTKVDDETDKLVLVTENGEEDLDAESKKAGVLEQILYKTLGSGPDMGLVADERAVLETAYFEQPVCSKCAESLKTKAGLPKISPSPEYRSRVWNVKEDKREIGRHYNWTRRGWHDGELKPGSTGTGGATGATLKNQVHAQFLARGAMQEPMVLHVKCRGVDTDPAGMEEPTPCERELKDWPSAYCRSCMFPYCKNHLHGVADAMAEGKLKELDLEEEQGSVTDKLATVFSEPHLICDSCLKIRTDGENFDCSCEPAESAWLIKNITKEEPPEEKVELAAAAAPPPEEEEDEDEDKPFHKRYCGWMFKGDDDDAA